MKYKVVKDFKIMSAGKAQKFKAGEVYELDYEEAVTAVASGCLKEVKEKKPTEKDKAAELAKKITES